MDILLINLKDPMLEKATMDSILKVSVDMVPLGLLYLGTVLEANGYSVELIDFNNTASQRDIDEILNEALANKPGIAGLSVSTPVYPMAKDISLKIREKLGNECFIVWGGYHCTFFPDQPIEEGYADLVVRGEGEEIMVKLADLLLGKKALPVDQLSTLEGISYKKNGTIAHNDPEIIRIDDLDKLPFPKREFLDLESYNNPSTIASTRGCVARCQFCAAGAWGGNRERTPDNVVDEVEFMVNKYGFSHIYFVDNTFASNKKRTMDMLGKILDKSLGASFSVETRAASIDEELIKMMAKSGVIALQFGVESGNQDILRSIHKGIKLEDVERGVELCLKHEIRPMCSFIVGHPEDTKETIRETIAFAKKLRRIGSQVVFSPLIPYPGTEVFNKRDELGVEIIDWNYSSWWPGKIIIKTKNLYPREIKNLYKEAVSEVLAI